MKKRFPLLLVVIILVAVVKVFSGNLFMSPEKLIAKGDEALANNDVDEALSYYNEAGVEGDEKEKELLTRIVLQKVSKASLISEANRYPQNLDDALEYLEDKAKYSLTEEERYEFLLDCCRQEMENILADGDNLYSAEKLLDAVSSKIPQQTPGYEEFLNDGYFTVGHKDLAASVAEGKEYGSVIREATWNWDKCTSGPGYECVQAIDVMIPQGNYQEGFSILTEYLEEELAFAIANELREVLTFNTVSEMFGYEAAYYARFPRTEVAASLTEAINFLDDAHMGDNHKNESIILNVSDLESACGLNPDGRILFLHKPNDDDDTVGLYLPMMDILPNAYYPHNLESVEYVVLMECEAVLTGATFGTSTKELREDTTVKAIDVKTGQVIFETLHTGPTTYMMSYSGDEPPAVYSAGAPNVREDVKDAIRAIESYMNP